MTGGAKAVAPEVILITEVARFGVQATLERAEGWCARSRAGAVVVQLRDRDQPLRERLQWGRRLRSICAAHSQRLVVNDRLDLALMLQADGVHLGEASVVGQDARRLLGPGAWISRACHDPSQVVLDTAVDAVLLSPLLAPRKGSPALGLVALAGARQLLEAAEAPRIGLYALGGLRPSDLDACRRAGADGIAMIAGAWA